MMITTHTHGHCAVENCQSPTRTDAIKARAGRWHLIDGFVYSQDRRAFVGDSWAHACDEHRDAVAAAVQADVEGWHGRWTVQAQTLDYGNPEGGSVEEYAEGIGTSEGRLF